MKFRVLIHKRAYDFLKSLDIEDRQRIIDKLKQLEDFPAVRLDIVKIAGEADTFRLLVGNYRALFKVYEQEKNSRGSQDRHKKKDLPINSSVFLFTSMTSFSPPYYMHLLDYIIHDSYSVCRRLQQVCLMFLV